MRYSGKLGLVTLAAALAQPAIVSATPVTFDVNGTLSIQSNFAPRPEAPADGDYALTGSFTIDTDLVHEVVNVGDTSFGSVYVQKFTGFNFGEGLLSSSFHVAGFDFVDGALLSFPAFAVPGKSSDLWLVGDDLLNPEGIWSFMATTDFWLLQLGTTGCGSECRNYGSQAKLADFLSFNTDTVASNITLTRRDTTSVPEPATLSLFALGLVGLRSARRRKLV